LPFDELRLVTDRTSPDLRNGVTPFTQRFCSLGRTPKGIPHCQMVLPSIIALVDLLIKLSEVEAAIAV
jgi:hypothetical protein